MFLPATGVNIPGDDWKVIHHEDYPLREDDAFPRFKAVILHIPTGFHLEVGSGFLVNKYSWNVVNPLSDLKTSESVRWQIMNQFRLLAVESLPVLKAEARRYGFGDNLWSDKGPERENLKDGLSEILISEYVIARKFNESTKLTVRNDTEDTYHSYDEEKPEDLNLDFEASYWDKIRQDWVKIQPEATP